MPVMNGLEATKRIRAEIPTSHQPCNNSSQYFNLIFPHTVIVALTANVFNEDQEEYVQAGMCNVLTKPIKKENLINVLKQCKLLP